MAPIHHLLRLTVLHLLLLRLADGLELFASLSQRGVKGEVRFASEGDDEGPVKLAVSLEVAEGSAGEYTWGIYEFPIDYTQEDYCHSRYLGRRPRINLEDLIGKLVLTSPPTPSLDFQVAEGLTLFGPGSIWGASLVLEGPGRERICSTILPDAPLQLAEARFMSPVAGSVYFHSLRHGARTETKIFTNLYHVGGGGGGGAGSVVEEEGVGGGGTSSDHPWQIFITDILGSNRKRQSCNFLQILFDPENKVGSGAAADCAPANPEHCPAGNLTGKFELARVGKQESMFTKKYYADQTLNLPDSLDGSSRSLYLALFDRDHPDSFYACAQIHKLTPRTGRALFRQDGISGAITLTQPSLFHPVVTTVNLTGLSGGAGTYHIHEFPVPLRLRPGDAPCGQTGGHYNPFGWSSSSAGPGLGTSDQYEMGDLSGKYGELSNQFQVQGRWVDPALTLFGARSVVGRSIVIHKSPVPLRWVCANIELADAEMLNAVAQFVYPVAGRIFLRQDQSSPLADTQVYVEGLLYSDGSRNTSDGHKWHVHEDVPGKDFFNWTGRCLSAGKHFNPYQIGKDESVYKACESEHSAAKCEVGDLVNKMAALAVAGRRRELAGTRRFFTDSNLPLSGPASVLGHSIVIHDDHAPEHRGNRMACTAIRRLYRHKGVAREWYGNGAPTPLTGRLEFIQDTELSQTHTLVELQGLEGEASTYHIHEIPVQPQLEFACSGDAVGGHFNPWHWDPSNSTATGTPDQYEAGDLSGKYGLLDSRRAVKEVHNDTNLPMFGAHSIVGRSVVVHKHVKGARWACATVGWGWDPDEARQVTAIASFHHPLGFAWGYIRFSQVVYNDGSATDTVIEVRLKYPGKTNREVTAGHNWAVYVNPVGHDATVKFKTARCTAAGYRWNPTFIQLADPNDRGFYGEECGPEAPLRCEVGDLSGRHGPIGVGGQAYVFNDVNLPLHGDWFNSALGKSVVVHDPDGSGEVMACANIEPDKDIIKYAVIKTLASFNLANFIEEVQAVLGVPDWFLFLDARETKELNDGKCLQILLHFRGPHANQLEQDFSRLMRTGRLDTPSLQIPGYFPPANRKTQLGYRECGSDNAGRRQQAQSGSAGLGASDDYGNTAGRHLAVDSVVLVLMLLVSLMTSRLGKVA